MLNLDYTCPIPENYYIETGNLCNLRCPFCPTGLRRKGIARSFLSKENYQIILDKISPYAKIIGLFNYGEPFLNKDILSIIALTSARGIYTSLHSNLTVSTFDEKSADAIVQSGLSCLSASIDGASQKTYGKYRVGGNFQLAISNLERLQRAKVRLNSQTPQLIWGFLINYYNEHEQEKAKKMASDLGVSIEFKLMDVWGNDSWKSSLHKTLERERAKATDDMHGMHDRQPLPTPINALRLHPKLPQWCGQVFNEMFIHWNGEVFPCCTVCEDRFALGNLLHEDIHELWNNGPYLKCRDFLYNYGPKQVTNSVCGTLPCALTPKSLVSG